jgi:N-acetylneuraminate synthase
MKTEPLIVGEVAQAHDGSLGAAHAFIDAIADAGANAVKFQTHIAAAESTPAEPWRVKFSYQDKTRYDYWKRMEFTEQQWLELKQHAERRKLLFLSSPFSSEAVELLKRVGVSAWKVASGEVSNRPMLEQMIATGLPMILSSGMNPWQQLDAAVDMIQQAALDLTVLQCSSIYPTPAEKLGLNLLSDLRQRYGCKVGLSDHSGTVFSGLAAVALGAAMVEVHVTFSREAFGPDVPASLTIAELGELVEGARFIRTALQNPINKDSMAAELSPMRSLFSKSIVAKRNLIAGTVLSATDLAFKKPGTGISPDRVQDVLGRRLTRDIQADTIIAESDLVPDEDTVSPSISKPTKQAIHV